MFDTETTVDTIQKLRLGCYRVTARRTFMERLSMPTTYRTEPHDPDWVLLEEGFIVPDDLRAEERVTLAEYIRTHPSAARLPDPDDDDDCRDELRRLVRLARKAVGLPPNAACVRCGEQSVIALKAKARGGITCYACGVRRRERHHLVGHGRSDIIVTVPANIHRELSDLQQDWEQSGEDVSTLCRHDIIHLASVHRWKHDNPIYNALLDAMHRYKHQGEGEGVHQHERLVAHPLKNLRLRSRQEFVEQVFYPLAVEARALVVGFNLPFDLSRIAVDVGAARGADAGGFSFVLSQYQDGNGRQREQKFRPRLIITPIDNKRSRIQFRGRVKSGRTLRNDFRGNFLDLRTLAFALTNRGHSLASLGKALRIEHPKLDVGPDGHGGPLTFDYLDYLRRDVLSTWQCFRRLENEYQHHPIAPGLPMTRAYSSASIAKAYLRAMGVDGPPLLVTDGLNLSPDAVLGAAMQSYYGGRAECHIRKVPVPVVYTDFLSMYPTVNSLMGLWRMLTAERVRVLDATDEVQTWLARLTLEDLFQPETWQRLRVLVQVAPDDDILPLRARYGRGQGWQIGVNHVTSAKPLWYTLSDAVAAKLLSPTGRAPTITTAIAFQPEGQREGLRPMPLVGGLPVSPAGEDFFKKVIEARKQIPPASDVDEPCIHSSFLRELFPKRVGPDHVCPACRAPSPRDLGLSTFFKTLANAGSYGIFIESNRQKGKKVPCMVWDGNAEPYASQPIPPEDPGPFAFPPLATFITGGARLMLALLERCVTDLGGTYAFCDTDSMAIVASPDGGLVPCPGGQERMADGSAAIRALSWPQVDDIVARFTALNPYDSAAVPGSVLKVEDVNSTDAGTQRLIEAYVISAKRYVLFHRRGVKERAGDVAYDDGLVIVAARAHGLGHLLDPTGADPDVNRHADVLPTDGVDEGADGGRTRPWHRDVWHDLLCEALGRPVPHRPWLERIAMMRVPVRSLQVWQAFQAWTTVAARRGGGGKGGDPRARAQPAARDRTQPYADQVKPLNFVMAPLLDRLSAPPGVDPARFRLMTTYEPDAMRWDRLWYVNLYDRDGPRYQVTTRTLGGEAQGGAVVVRDLQSVRDDFHTHPEPKSAAPDGRPCGRMTMGLLVRRHVHAGARHVIGKESNDLEMAAAGLVGSPDDILNTYRREGERDRAPADLVRRLPAAGSTRALAAKLGVPPRTLQNILAGRTRTLTQKTYRTLERALADTPRDAHAQPDLTPTVPRSALADRLAAACDRHGERAVARLVGVSQPTLHRWRVHGLPRRLNPQVRRQLAQV